MVKILVAGDFAPRARVTSLFEAGKYPEVLSEVVPFTSQADYSVINLEAPIVTSAGVEPIDKCGPNLKCSRKAVEALKYAGFNLVTLANNHFYDYGDEGARDTLLACREHKIDVVGGGMSLEEASRTFYRDIKGLKFAFINCCEHEFSIATDKSGGANPINPVKQFYAIQEAVKLADYVIVIVHGGHEYYQLPSPRMQELYRFFIDAGAAVVINHHQHCYSGYEVYNNRPIFYGLGNFCFDWENNQSKMWNEGYLLSLDFYDNEIAFKIIPYVQCEEKPAVVFFQDTNTFNKQLNELNAIIANESRLEAEKEQYYDLECRNIFGVMEPVQNRYIVALQKRKLLPTLQSPKWLLKLYNYIRCESHRDKLEYYLKTKIYQ